MTEQSENRPEVPQASTNNAQETPRVDVIKSPDFKMVYANNLSLHATAWDMHLTFGELYKDVSGKEVLEQRLTIALSLHVAKALAAIVANGVANYEAQVGEVKMPPDLQIALQVQEQKPGEPSA